MQTIIHTHNHYAANLSKIISRLLRIKTIQTCHGIIPEEGRLSHFSADYIISVNEHIIKYLIENKLGEQNFEILENLEDNNIKKFSCLCVVQHHNKTKLKLEQIYRHGQIPMIYDCQNRLEKIAKSKSILTSLGGHDDSDGKK